MALDSVLLPFNPGFTKTEAPTMLEQMLTPKKACLVISSTRMVFPHPQPIITASIFFPTVAFPPVSGTKNEGGEKENLLGSSKQQCSCSYALLWTEGNCDGKRKQCKPFFLFSFWLFALPETICLLKGFKGGMQNWFGFRRLRENCIKLQQKMTQNFRNIRQWFHRKRYLLAAGGGKNKERSFSRQRVCWRNEAKEKWAKQRRVNGLENGGEVFFPIPVWFFLWQLRSQ